MSELIHTSSDHQNLDTARVTVHFHEIVDHVRATAPRLRPQALACIESLCAHEVLFCAQIAEQSPRRAACAQAEGDGFEAVPGSDLTVAREAHRDNSSKYILNGRTSNFTEACFHRPTRLPTAKPPAGPNRPQPAPCAAFGWPSIRCWPHLCYCADGTEAAGGLFSSQVTTVLKAKGVDLDNNRFLILQASFRSHRAPAHCTPPHTVPFRTQYPSAHRTLPATARATRTTCLQRCLLTRTRPLLTRTRPVAASPEVSQVCTPAILNSPPPPPCCSPPRRARWSRSA